MEGPRPSSAAAPSIWYAEAANPQAKPVGKRAASAPGSRSSSVVRHGPIVGGVRRPDDAAGRTIHVANRRSRGGHPRPADARLQRHDGPGAGSAERLGRGAGGGRHAVPGDRTSGIPRQVRRLTTALQAAARARAGARRPAAADRGRPGGRPAAGARRRVHPVRRARWRSARPATRSSRSAWAGRSGGSCAPSASTSTTRRCWTSRSTRRTRRSGSARSATTRPRSARLARAWLRGLQSAGVAGTGKHFPGKGEGSVDTHLALDVVDRIATALEARRAACRSGRRSRPASGW